MSKLPPPFIFGETYLDREGDYVVTKMAGNEIEIQRPDGRRLRSDARVKAQIHRNLIAESNSVHVVSNRTQDGIGPPPRAGGILEEMFWCIAEIIEKYSKFSKEYCTHDFIVSALMEHNYAGPILKQRSERDANGPSPEWFASDYVAFYSKEWTEGRPGYAHSFERTKMQRKWAYRVRV